MIPIEPHNSCGPFASVLWVVLAGGSATILFVFVLWRYFVFRHRTRATQAAAAKPQSLVPGRVLLSGLVETDDDSPPVRIDIEQAGIETKSKNSYSHEWREVGRVVRAQPFRLRLANDETVTVAPDDDVRLVDALETDSVDGSFRHRVAQLTKGESVWVSGVLAHEGSRSAATTAYRTGTGSLVLRGTRMEPLEIASGTLEAQFAYWRRFYRNASIVLGLLFVTLHGGLFLPFHAKAFAGEVATATITNTSTYITKSKNKTTTHYVIHAKLPPEAGGHEVRDDVDFSDYEAARTGRLKHAPFIYVPAIPVLHSIGGYPDLHVVLAFLGMILAVVTAILFPLARRSAMPWYEQKRVIERGSGRLSQRAWAAQIPGKPGLYEERRRPPKAAS